MNKRGVALIICYMVIVALSILGAAFLMRSVSERSVAGKYFDSTQAFWLAEAGVNKAIAELRASYINYTSPVSGNLGPGEYLATITSNGDNRTVTATGYIPSAAAAQIERVVAVTLIKYIPPGFYDNAIYSAGNVTIGSNCVVNGDVFSGGAINGPVNGDATPNDTVLHNNGLPLLNFDDLKRISQEQGWYNSDTGVTTFPSSFWNVAPVSPEDPGIPNVVFVNGDFTLVGGKQVVQGFIVVGGNTVYNAEIGGNASIIGCLYTRGNIWFHGGGGKVINVDGGVWAGGTVTMEGNEQINFDPPAGHGETYMNAIKALGINADVQVTSWQEMQNPY